MKDMEVDQLKKSEEEAQNGHGKTEYKHQKDISTFVFMDLETTSLLEGRQKPRIAELCLVAVHRADLKDVAVKKKPTIPRVTNKLTICLNPGKPMSFGSSEVTGLFNDSLEHQKRLSGVTVGLINHFIDHLTKPVCLLAHNGHGFDFPVLMAELSRIGENLGDILCADTLEAFRSLDGLPARYEPYGNQTHRSIYQGYTPSTQIIWKKAPGVKRKSTDDEIIKTNPKLIKHNIDQFDVNITSNDNEYKAHEADKVKKKLFVDESSSEEKTTKQNFDNEAKPGEHSKEDTSDFDEFSSSLEDNDYVLALENVENQLRNTDSSTTSAETSQKSSDDSFTDPQRSNSKDSQNVSVSSSLLSATTLSSSVTTSCPKVTSIASLPFKVSPTRQESAATTPTKSSSSTSTTQMTQGVVSSTGQTQPVHRQSYTLKQVYTRKFASEPENSHLAESDCLTLLKIAGQTPDLLEWVDQNAVKFSSVKPAY